jgi:hypothetical protein
MKNETNWIIFLFTCKEIYITAIIVIEISEFKLFGFPISFTCEVQFVCFTCYNNKLIFFLDKADL